MSLIEILFFITLTTFMCIMAQVFIFPKLPFTKKVERSISLYRKNRQSSNMRVREKMEEGIELFLESLKFDRDNNAPVRSIVKYLGGFEIFFFAIITLVMLYGENQIIFDKDLITSVGIWLGIKVIGNYKQWSDPILGRAIFYIFLLGTLINIILGILAGLISLSFHYYINL